MDGTFQPLFTVQVSIYKCWGTIIFIFANKIANINTAANKDEEHLFEQMSKLTKTDLINRLKALGMETNGSKHELMETLISTKKVYAMQPNLKCV